MSELETGSGVLLPPPPDAGNGSDNNADSDSSASSKDSNSIIGEDTNTLKTFYAKMCHIFKELAVMLLMFVTYAALTHDPPKISKSPPAYPFFPKGSIVKDWYRGETSAAVNAITDSDIGFMMFYAPWDAESQEVRAEMELAALHMHKMVAFSAVNCWQPYSECRIKYGKVFSWPVLLAYTTHGRVIQYNGPKTAPHMMRFLNNVMNPYVRINSTMEIYSLLAEHDAVVVAAVDASPGSLDFAIFYSIALKYLEKDPFGDIAFAMMAKSREQEPFLSLHMWNETLIYPHDEEFNTETVVNWLSKSIHQVSIWISPSGTKSQHLSTYLQGPSLILFTPHNPLAEMMDYYGLFREVAMEYFNCDNEIKQNAIRMSIYWHRRLNMMKYNKISEICSKKMMMKDHLETVKRFTQTVTYSPSLFWQNNSACFRDKHFKCFDSEAPLADHWIGKYDNVKVYYENIVKKGPAVSVEECTERNELNRFKTSMVNDPSDLKSARELLKRFKERICKFNQLTRGFLPLQFSHEDTPKINLTGYACKSNRSLSFIAMDSLKYHHFAERYGVNVLKQKNKTVLLIVNEKEEVHHVHSGHITDGVLKQFIINFTESNLARALHSSSAKFKHTHVYPIKKDCGAGDKVCVDELDSETFMPTIMEDNKVVIVFYHSKQCSFCNGISYTFLMAAKVLSFAKNIKFARIDGDLNTLPWEYTMETYPTILLFPSKRKSESRAFPQDLPVTVSNIISFILTNLEPTLKLNVMWSICNHTAHDEDKATCISSLRVENLAVIEQTLKEWRMADLRTKQRILRKLQQLRSLHLELALSPYNQNTIGKHFDKLSKSSLKSVLFKVVKDQMRQWHDDL